VHFPGIQRTLIAKAMEVFYEVREVPGLKKKPSTSELLDWLKLLLNEDMPLDVLQNRDPTKAIPPLHGALLKNEQDIMLFERLAADAVHITGTTGSASWTAASGNTLTFHFCPACGTQVYAQSSARPQIKTVRIGVIDQPHEIRPKAVIWTDDAPAWAVFDPTLEQFAGQPPAPVPNP
jgi:hypothetical protein